jgi:hypothetical protein
MLCDHTERSALYAAFQISTSCETEALQANFRQGAHHQPLIPERMSRPELAQKRAEEGWFYASADKLDSFVHENPRQGI